MNTKKSITLAFAILLIVAILMPLNVLFVNAQYADKVANTRDNAQSSFAFVGANPNPVQVGTRVLLHYGISAQIGNAAAAFAGQSWVNMTMILMRPDGTNETLTLAPTDTTGGSSVWYTPTQTGNYTLVVYFPEQICPFTTAGIPAGSTMKASNSVPLTLVVQDEPIARWVGVPLPTQYWTRPINGMLYEWFGIGGDWLENKDYFANRETNWNVISPLSSHILWTKPITAGGMLSGGFSFNSPGGLTNAGPQFIDYGGYGYYTGGAYNNYFRYTVIISGVVYYNVYQSRGAASIGQPVAAVDLHTGELKWQRGLIGMIANSSYSGRTNSGLYPEGQSDLWPNGQSRQLRFGSTNMFSSYNAQGAYGFLWTISGSTWMCFDAFDGHWLFTIINVPSGTDTRGSFGEPCRIVYSAGNYMALWNSSAIVSLGGSFDPHGYVYNATAATSATNPALGTYAAQAYSWNVTIPSGLPGGVVAAYNENKIVGQSFNNYYVYTWALSLKTGSQGALLFNNTFTAPLEWALSNRTTNIRLADVNIPYNIYTIVDCDRQKFYGVTLDTGTLAWGPTEPTPSYLDLYQEGMTYSDSHGILFCNSVGGDIQARNVTTGTLLWTTTT